MINPYYFIDRNLKVGFKINLDTHHINHANSKLTIKLTYPEFGTETRYINKVLEELSVFHATIINQYKFKQYSQHDSINKMKIIKY